MYAKRTSNPQIDLICSIDPPIVVCQADLFLLVGEVGKLKLLLIWLKGHVRQDTCAPGAHSYELTFDVIFATSN